MGTRVAETCQMGTTYSQLRMMGTTRKCAPFLTSTCRGIGNDLVGTLVSNLMPMSELYMRAIFKVCEQTRPSPNTF